MPDKEMEKYIKKIARKLNLPKDIKARVTSDVETSIRARMEAGEPAEAIMEAMGSPGKVAGELNEQMKEYTYRKSGWRYVFLAAAILAAFLLLWEIGLTMLTLNEIGSICVIGGADGPTAIFVTTAIDSGFPTETAATILLFVAGIFGFWRLGRCKKK